MRRKRDGKRSPGQAVTPHPTQSPQAAPQGNNGRERGGQLVLEQHSFYMGPLPPATELEQYRLVQQDFPERMMAMAERQSAHRQAIEKKVVWANTRNETLGVISAFLLGLVGEVGGIFLVMMGRNLEGLTAMLGTLATLIGVFAWNKKKTPSPPPPPAKRAR